MDYSLITQEELTKRLQSLSDSEKAVLISEDMAKILEDIASAYDFDEEEMEMLKQIVSLVILKVIPKSELKKELKENIEIDEQIANFIYDALQENVFALSDLGSLTQAPLAPAFAATFNSSVPKQSAYVPASPRPIIAATPAPIITPANNRITPIKTPSVSTSFKPEGNKIASTTEPAPAPFIIHERSDVKATAAPIQSFGASKQTFIKPQFTPVGTNPPATARIQFGDQVLSAKKDLLTPKIVNYGVANPKAANPKPQPDTSSTIDLRDLPR